jgi:hypothetical protein
MMMPVFFILVLVFLVLPLFNEIKILNQSRLLEISNNILIQELESDSIVLIGDNTPTKSAALKHGNGFAGGTFTREIESISNHAVYLQEISGEFANIRNFNLVDSANNKVTCNSRNLRAPNSVIIFLTRNPLGSQSYSQLDEIRINETTFSDLSSVSDLGDYRVIRLSDFSCT